MVFFSQRAPGGRLVCGGLPCVGHPLHSFTDPSGVPQAPVLAAHCVCFSLRVLSPLPQGEGGEPGLPGARGLPGATGPKVTLQPRASGAASQGQGSGAQAQRCAKGTRGCQGLRAVVCCEPWKQRDLLLCKETEQVLARAVPGCAEPGPGAALHRPPVKIQTDPAFRGFCIKAGRTRIILVHGMD